MILKLGFKLSVEKVVGILVFGTWLGPLEIGLILLIVLIIFGPSKLPQLARAVGQSIREFKKASSEKEESVESEVIEAAKKLGIDTEGKSKEEIVEEIKKKLGE